MQFYAEVKEGGGVGSGSGCKRVEWGFGMCSNAPGLAADLPLDPQPSFQSCRSRTSRLCSAAYTIHHCLFAAPDEPYVRRELIGGR